MSIILHFFRYLLLPLALTFIAFKTVQTYDFIWQPWQSIINELPYYLLCVTAILAVQFNSSRISYLSILFAIYYIVHKEDLLAIEHLTLYKDHILLAGSFIIALLSFSKDNCLISIHTIEKLIAMAICAALGYSWLHFLPQLLPQLGLTLANPIKDYVPLALSLFIPIALSAALVFIAAAWRATDTNTALAVTLFIWLFNYFQPEFIPLSIQLSLLSILYLLTLILESYNLAYRDPLTGLSSMKALENLANSLNSHYCIAIIDVDNLKDMSKRYGEELGNQVLKLVASRLKRIAGNSKAFRYNDDRLLIVFKGTNAEKIIPNLDALRCEIRDYDIVLRGDARRQNSKRNRELNLPENNNKINVTVSIGMAEHGEGAQLSKVIQQAIKALTIAKNNGCNRIFI